MDYTTLDQLMTIRKKSDANKGKKQLYCKEIINALYEVGIAPEIEKYLKEGFSFASTEPIQQYLLSLPDDEQQKQVKKLFDSKMFSENDRGISLKICMSLLARNINKGEAIESILNNLIVEIPNKSIGKDGKRLKDAKKSLEKYFLKEVNTSKEFVELSDRAINKGLITTFSNYMYSLLKDISMPDSEDSKTVLAVKKWLNGQKYEGTDDIAIKNNNGTSSKKFDLKNFRKSFDDFVLHTENLEMGKKILEVELRSVKESNKKLTEQLQVEQKAVSKLNNKMKKSEQTIQEKDNKIISLEKDISNFGAISSVYAKDKENSQSEILNAIASRLKTEYFDFQDAEEMEMSIELGDNLREQLKSVFKILQKSGIVIERK